MSRGIRTPGASSLRGGATRDKAVGAVALVVVLTPCVVAWAYLLPLVGRLIGVVQ